MPTGLENGWISIEERIMTIKFCKSRFTSIAAPHSLHHSSPCQMRIIRGVGAPITDHSSFPAAWSSSLNRANAHCRLRQNIDRFHSHGAQRLLRRHCAPVTNPPCPIGAQTHPVLCASILQTGGHGWRLLRASGKPPQTVNSRHHACLPCQLLAVPYCLR